VLIGEGLFSSEGDLWRRQRRLAQPAFHADCLRGFVTTMIDSTVATLDRWQAYVGDASPLTWVRRLDIVGMDVGPACGPSRRRSTSPRRGPHSTR
jgi:hypothetical protein